ncbi:MAG: methyltransferase domain-containing protein [Bacteroidales bacterium]|nr:methyltransferase domain-containing protein [Bacteroidales bacterium]MBO7183193.1 methyltransferase domain-containing protein [Bacteroidales bacterium]
MANLNLYGDNYVATSGSHGADISSQRCDELDNMALAFVSGMCRPRVLDIGCGFAAQSLRFAHNGADVVAVDIMDISQHLSARMKQEGLPLDKIVFHNTDVQFFLKNNVLDYDVIYSQRFIHYLNPLVALDVVRRFYNILSDSGRIFISASGINSELSTDYIGRDINVMQRFEYLKDQMRIKHGITERVCLYRPDELEWLFKRAGFKTMNIWESAFGNVKAIFTK